MNNAFWKSAITAGIIAAAVMLILELIMNPLFLDAPIWGPPRMMAAIVLGEGVLPPPATFDLGVILAAMVVHFSLSIIFAVILALIIRGLSAAVASIVGAAFGLVLYLVNFFLFTAIFPWFADARNWVQVVIHILFGLVAAWIFKYLQGKNRVTGAVA